MQAVSCKSAFILFFSCYLSKFSISSMLWFSQLRGLIMQLSIELLSTLFARFSKQVKSIWLFCWELNWSALVAGVKLPLAQVEWLCAPCDDAHFCIWRCVVVVRKGWIESESSYVVVLLPEPELNYCESPVPLLVWQRRTISTLVLVALNRTKSGSSSCLRCVSTFAAELARDCALHCWAICLRAAMSFDDFPRQLPILCK